MNPSESGRIVFLFAAVSAGQAGGTGTVVGSPPPFQGTASSAVIRQLVSPALEPTDDMLVLPAAPARCGGSSGRLRLKSDSAPQMSWQTEIVLDADEARTLLTALEATRPPSADLARLFASRPSRG